MDKLDRLQQLMVITAEECGELTQVTSKILRKAEIDPEWREKLLEEAGDVVCMIDLMTEHELFTWQEVDERIAQKRNKLKKWSDLIDG